ATFAWRDVELVAGVDAMRSEHRGRSSTYHMMGGGYVDADRFPWSKDAVMHDYGAVAELTWHAAERSRLVAGARLDRASARDFRESVRGMANPTADSTRADTLPSGFARFEHDLADSPTTLYVGLGHVQRFPDYWELFSPRRGPAGEVNAFAGIEPEKTTQLDFGVQYAGEDLQAWISGYVGQVRDYILFDYQGDMMGGSRADNIDARILGGELGLAYGLDQHWSTDATLAYAWGKNSSDG